MGIISARYLEHPVRQHKDNSITITNHKFVIEFAIYTSGFFRFCLISEAEDLSLRRFSTTDLGTLVAFRSLGTTNAF